MKVWKLALVTLTLCTLPALPAADAAACGACIVAQNEVTQVVGHRMVFSISQNATTLWDQIQYSGDPQSFAWVLPIKGKVDVGISSDALFQVLDQTTRVTISSPTVSCGNAGAGGVDTGAGGNGGGGAGGGGVTVIDYKLVGPYETVQLSSQDPNALADWLASHGYVIPANLDPVIAAYVSESFDFLALKLVPGKGTESMRPVRVTTPGAGFALPLRMVAGGAGAFTPIQLWIVAEGRYEPKSFPSAVIDPKDVVWNWATNSSNYSALRDQVWRQGGDSTWLTDFACVVSATQIDGPMKAQALAQYADDQGKNAQANLDADLSALHGSQGSQSLYITHISARLSLCALANDLQLQASASQDWVSNVIETTTAIGFDPCGGPGGSGAGASGAGAPGAGGSGATTGAGGVTKCGKGGGSGSGSSGGCNLTSAPSAPVYGALLGALLTLAGRMRRRRHRGEPDV